jgi:hypothetical protein
MSAYQEVSKPRAPQGPLHPELVPRTLSVNPSLTFMALATRLADHLHTDARGYLAGSSAAAAA